MNNPKPKSGAGRGNWRTPPDLFAILNNEFGFTIDVAADESNHLCERYLSGPHPQGVPYFGPTCPCGLCAPWNDMRYRPGGYRPDVAYCNPPYSNIPPWVEAIELEPDMTRVLLVPGDPSANWYQRACMTAWEERRVRNRVPFIDPDTGKPVAGNFRPSTVFVWRPGPRPYPQPALSWLNYP